MDNNEKNRIVVISAPIPFLIIVVPLKLTPFNIKGRKYGVIRFKG